MIEVDLPTIIRCEHPEGCETKLKARMFLLTGGGFGFAPGEDPTGWQIMAPKGHGMPFVSRCPAHASSVARVTTQVGPAGPRLVVSEPH